MSNSVKYFTGQENSKDAPKTSTKMPPLFLLGWQRYTIRTWRKTLPRRSMRKRIIVTSLWQQKSFRALFFQQLLVFPLFLDICLSLETRRHPTNGGSQESRPALDYRLSLGFLWFVMHGHCLDKHIILHPRRQDLVTFAQGSTNHSFDGALDDNPF